MDEVCGYGTDAYCLKYGWCYKVLDKEHPANDGSGFWGVFIISGDGGWHEWQIGHLSEIYIKPGEQVFPWTIVGKEGNRGQVVSWGQLITKEMQDAGDKRGSHRHWNKKLLKRMRYEDYDKSKGQFLSAFSFSTPSAYRDPQGWYYEVLDYQNGLRGSVNPMDDVLRGYEAVRKHFNPPVEDVSSSDAKVVTEGLKTVSEALKYPSAWARAMEVLKALSAFLRRKP